jgi:hypothetical protein
MNCFLVENSFAYFHNSLYCPGITLIITRGKFVVTIWKGDIAMSILEKSTNHLKLLCKVIFALFPVSISAQHWEKIGPFGGQVYCAEKIGNRLILGSYTGDIYYSMIDSSKGWMHSTCPLIHGIVSLQNCNGKLFACAEYPLPRILFQSADSGKNWSEIQVSSDTNLIFAGLVNRGDSIYALSSYGLIFKSPNRGISWSKPDSSLYKIHTYGTPVDYIQKPRCFYANSKCMFINTLAGWYRKFNDRAWEEMSSFKGFYSLLVSEDIIYAAGDSGFCISQDNGNTWTRDYSQQNVIPLSIFNGVLYAQRNDGESLKTIVRSFDNGKTWKDYIQISPTVNNSGKFWFFDTSAIVLSNKGQLFQRTGTQEHWIDISQGLNNCRILGLGLRTDSVTALVKMPGQAPEIYYMGRDMAEFVANSWSTGINLLHDYEDPYVFASTNSFYFIGGPCYMDGRSKTLYKILPGTSSLQAIDVGPPDDLNRYFCALTVKNDTFFYSTCPFFSSRASILRCIPPSADSKINTFCTLPDSVSITTACPGKPFLIGTTNGIYKIDSSVTAFVKIAGLQGRNILVIDQIPGVSFASTDNGVFRSLTNTNTWIPANNGLPARSSVTYMKTKDSLVFCAAQNYGVYYSKDFGDSWIPIKNGLESLYFTGMELHDKTLFIGTSNSSVFSFDITSLLRTATQKYNQIGNNQNFIAIRKGIDRKLLIFTKIPQQTSISVNIYSLQGHSIRSFKKTYNTAGENCFNLNLHSFARGVYILQVKADAHIKTEKFSIP